MARKATFWAVTNTRETGLRRGKLNTSRRELEVHRPPGAALQQLDLDLADATADLEHGRALDPARLEERHDPPRGLVEPPLAVALRDPARELLPEEGVTAARVTAARHRRPTSSRLRRSAARVG